MAELMVSCNTVYSPQIESPKQTNTQHTNTVDKTVSFIVVTYWNTVKRILTREQMIQKQLHHQSPPQEWQQLTNVGNSEHTRFRELNLLDRALPRDWVELHLFNID